MFQLLCLLAVLLDLVLSLLVLEQGGIILLLHYSLSSIIVQFDLQLLFFDRFLDLGSHGGVCIVLLGRLLLIDEGCGIHVFVDGEIGELTGHVIHVGEVNS